MRHFLPRWTIAQGRRSGLIVAAVIVAAVAACGGDSATGPAGQTTPVGSYTMSTVNGKSLPVSLFADGSFNFEVTSGNIRLTSDGKFLAVTNTRQTLPGSVENFVDSTGGTWVLTGTSVTFTSTVDGTTETGTWNKGSNLTLVSVDAGLTTTIVYGLTK